jgi:hypothetical protein
LNNVPAGAFGSNLQFPFTSASALADGPARLARPVRLVPVQTRALVAIPAQVVIRVQVARLAQAD